MTSTPVIPSGGNRWTIPFRPFLEAISPQPNLFLSSIGNAKTTDKLDHPPSSTSSAVITAGLLASKYGDQQLIPLCPGLPLRPLIYDCNCNRRLDRHWSNVRSDTDDQRRKSLHRGSSKGETRGRNQGTFIRTRKLACAAWRRYGQKRHPASRPGDQVQRAIGYTAADQ